MTTSWSFWIDKKAWPLKENNMLSKLKTVKCQKLLKWKVLSESSVANNADPDQTSFSTLSDLALYCLLKLLLYLLVTFTHLSLTILVKKWTNPFFYVLMCPTENCWRSEKQGWPWSEAALCWDRKWRTRKIQPAHVISKSKGLSEILRDIRTST